MKFRKITESQSKRLQAAIRKFVRKIRVIGFDCEDYLSYGGIGDRRLEIAIELYDIGDGDTYGEPVSNNETGRRIIDFKPKMMKAKKKK